MDSRTAILHTLCYSDIFDFPLTHEELWESLIAPHPLSKRDFQLGVNMLLEKKHIEKIDEYFVLSQRETIISLRQKRQLVSQKKYMRAKKFSRLLSFIPTIMLIGISGGLAMENADEGDDSDLFIVAYPGSIWITRVLVLILLELMHVRRKRNATQVKDSICVNMFLTPQAFSFPKEKQTLYQAHELVQLMPLIERGNTYKKLMDKNMWLRAFLPNANLHTRGKRLRTNTFFVLCCKFFESAARWLQLRSIKKHRTRETIRDIELAFHPIDYQEKIMEAYNKKKEAYGKI